MNTAPLLSHSSARPEAGAHPSASASQPAGAVHPTSTAHLGSAAVPAAAQPAAASAPAAVHPAHAAAQPVGAATQHPAAAPAPIGLVPVLAGRALTKVYGGDGASTTALDGVDLDIAAADSLAVMGPSGCGKTTLLHTLAGILQPTSGTVLHDGTDLASLSDHRRTRLRRSAFGFVFQDGQLLPELTALENVILPRMLGGTSRRAATKEARAWLDRLGLAGMHDRRPTQLSGGQAQRVAIARALAGRPSVVFADEPTGALDQATGHSVLDVLVSSCHDSGAALVMVTHDPQVAAVCRRTVAMRDGRIAQEFVRPDAEVQRGPVGHAPVGPATAQTGMAPVGPGTTVHPTEVTR